MFNIVPAILIILINKGKEIKGRQIGKEEIKLSISLSI
jgi:hypothetical protein